MIAFGGAPHLGFSVDPTRPQFNTLTLVDGKWPGAGELVVDKTTAGKKDLEVGQTIGVEANGPGAADEDLRARQVRRRVEPRRRDARRLRPADGAGALRQRRQARPDPREGESRASRPSSSRPRSRRSCRRARRCGPARPRRPRTRPTRRASSASCRSSCSRSAASRSSSAAFVIANSLSITIAQRTREFATLRTLGASRRQVLRLDLHRGARHRRARVGRRRARRLRARGGALQALRRGRLHAAEQRPRRRRRARSSSRCSSARSSPCSPACARRCARRACRRSPRCARARSLPEGRFARYRPVASGLLTLLGFAALAYGLFGGGLSTTGILVFMGLGTVLIFFGVALLSARIARPLAGALGWPAARLAGVRRHARARQRAAEPAAHRVDRVGADDRARARDARRRARRRHHVELPGRRQRPLDRRLRDHGRGQLLADPDRGRQRRGARRRA